MNKRQKKFQRLKSKDRLSLREMRYEVLQWYKLNVCKRGLLKNEV